MPEGWKLVPVEPTEEMLKAAKKRVTGPGGAVFRSQEYIFAGQFKAALEVAPTPPATIPLETLVAEMESDPETKVALNEARKKDMLEGATVEDMHVYNSIADNYFKDAQDVELTTFRERVIADLIKNHVIVEETDKLRKAAKEALAFLETITNLEEPGEYEKVIESLQSALEGK